MCCKPTLPWTEKAHQPHVLDLLDEAARNGHPVVVEHLVDFMAEDSNNTAHSGISPEDALSNACVCAASHGHLHVVKSLVMAGAKLNVQDEAHSKLTSEFDDALDSHRLMDSSHLFLLLPF